MRHSNRHMDDGTQLHNGQQSGRQPDNRAPEEIERDIQRTREEVSSTIEAIQSKLTPGQMMDQALSYARHSLPADFGSNLGNSVRENPLPVTLIGVGIAWLMMSGQQGQRSRSHAYDRSVTLDRSTRGAHATYDDASPYAYEESNEKPGSAVHHAMDRATQTGQDMKNRVSESSRQVKERISGTSQQMKERISGTGQQMKERASHLGHRSQENYYRAKDRFGQLLDEQPLVLGALGIALGASLGAAMPRTRREDDLMGSTRDSLMEQAKQRASEQAGKVQEKASQVMNEAKSEVQSGNAAGSNPGAAAGDDHPSRSEAQPGYTEEQLILVETNKSRPITPDGAGDSSRQQSLH